MYFSLLDLIHNELYIHHESFLVPAMKLHFSMTTLLSKLLSQAPAAPSQELDDGRKIGTTVRFDTRTRYYIDQQAEHLGISAQEFVSMTFRALMLAGDDRTGLRSELELMSDRFLEVFANHKIAAADIPSLLGDKITKSDLMSSELINKIDNEVIDKISDIFNLDIDWLKGVSTRPVNGPYISLYKNLYGAATRLIQLMNLHRRISVMFVAQDTMTFEQLSKAKEKGDSTTRVEMGVVIHISNRVNDVSFDTFEVWDAERWNYWRCRYYLKSLMWFTERAGINWKGVLVPKEHFNEIFEGEHMAVDYLSHYRSVWYPDQLFWEDDSNLERDEISAIKKFYEDERVSPLEKIAKTPYLIQNLKEFLAGNQSLRFREND